MKECPSSCRIDSHTHVFLRDLPLTLGDRHAPEHDAPLEILLGIFDEHRITHGVLTAPSFYGTDNSFLLAALRAEPARLRGTVIVDPSFGKDRLAEMGHEGVVGIRFNCFRQRDLPDLHNPEWRRLLERVGGLGWHVEVYVEGPRLPVLLEPLLDMGVAVVVDHFGSPDPVLGVDCPSFRVLLDGLQTGRVWTKLSAPYRLGGANPSVYAEALMRAGSPERLVFASDWPWSQNRAGLAYAQCLSWLDTWIPNAADRETILGPTPWSLFGFGSRAS